MLSLSMIASHQKGTSFVALIVAVTAVVTAPVCIVNVSIVDIISAFMAVIGADVIVAGAVAVFLFCLLLLTVSVGLIC